MCESFEIYDDNLVENDETVVVFAGFVSNLAGSSLVSNNASTIISDNDCKFRI